MSDFKHAKRRLALGLYAYSIATSAWMIAPPGIARRSLILREREVSLNELQEAVGGGKGMGKKRKEPRVHVSKYGNSKEKKDPWTEALERAADESSRHKAPVWLAVAKIFAAANSTQIDRRQLRRHRRFDGCDPETFGFVFCGCLVGAHGVRGAVRVDAPTDREIEARLTRPGIIYLLLNGRRAPRPVRLDSGRRLRSLGANIRYVLSITGLEERDVAQALAGAQLYMAHDEHLDENDDNDDDIASLLELEGAAVFDRQGQAIGTVFDVLDPTPESGLAQRLLQLDLGPHLHDPKASVSQLDERRRHCYVPLAEPILYDYNSYTNTITLDPPPGLLDLHFVYEPPPAIIRGFLPPPTPVECEKR